MISQKPLCSTVFPTSQGLPFVHTLDKNPMELTKSLFFLVWIDQSWLGLGTAKHSTHEP